MRGCNPTPTKTDRARFEALQALGCIACRHEGHFNEPCEIHHIKQRRHHFTIPLCPYHHRGEPISHLDIDTTRLLKGPSLFHDKRTFVHSYGSEMELLAETNRLISGES